MGVPPKSEIVVISQRIGGPAGGNFFPEHGRAEP
jgi:hypothetical protein